jgi:putative DNA primase/helicase
MNVQQFESTAYLSPKHKSHIESRGLLNDWSFANCRTLSAAEASVYLGYAAKSGGILFLGNTIQIQFKPDKPWKSESSKKAPKYRSPLGEYDAFLPQHPTDKNYWEPENLKLVCYQINGHPCLLLTEGPFKGISGCANGIPTIALLGVSMGLTSKKGDIQGKRYLVETLEKYARAGFGFIFAFDADAATNPNVIWEQRKLGRQLLKFNVPVYSITGHWDMGSEGETKGMDDFIQKKGIEEFRRMLVKSVSFQDWESSQDSSGDWNKTASKPPTPRQVARQLAEDYGQMWKFDNETKTWRIWTGKHWERTDDGNFRTLVKTTIDARNIEYKGSSYISDVLSLLTDDLRVKHWEIWDRKRYIAFDDSVWDSETGSILKHSPGMGFTSFLPYQYKPLTGTDSDAIDTLRNNCPNIYQWMNTTMQGDRQKILKLLAIVNGLLKFRFFDLQMFVHLIGKPGSGKGTFIRLLQKIVGRENWKGCKLRSMDDGSTMAGIIDKQLVACPDERAASGVDAILSMTGGDAVSYREVYKPASDAFFYGLLVVGSNNPIFVGDTTGLDRRLCLVHFDNPLPTALRNSKIEAGMDAEISQLIAVALSLADSAVSERIQGLGNSQIAEFKLQEWEMKLQTNSVAAHFDDCLIVDPTASIPTGKLYEHYKNWCDSNLKAVSHIKYPKMLSELCNDYLEISGVKWKRSGGRSWFEGLRLRSELETNIPTHTDTLSASIGRVSDGNTGCKSRIDGVSTGLGRGSEALSNGNYSYLRGNDIQNISENLKSSSSSSLLESSHPFTESSHPLLESSHPFTKSSDSLTESSDSLTEESQGTSHQTEIIEKVGLNPTNPVEIPETLPDMNLSNLQGEKTQNFSENLESPPPLIEESQRTSHQTEIINKVGLNPTNPVEIPEPLPNGNLSQPTNSIPTPCEPIHTPYLSTESEVVQGVSVQILSANAVATDYALRIRGAIATYQGRYILPVAGCIENDLVNDIAVGQVTRDAVAMLLAPEEVSLFENLVKIRGLGLVDLVRAALLDEDPSFVVKARDEVKKAIDAEGIPREVLWKCFRDCERKQLNAMLGLARSVN